MIYIIEGAHAVGKTTYAKSLGIEYTQCACSSLDSVKMAIINMWGRDIACDRLFLLPFADLSTLPSSQTDCQSPQTHDHLRAVRLCSCSSLCPEHLLSCSPPCAARTLKPSSSPLPTGLHGVLSLLSTSLEESRSRTASASFWPPL